MRRLSDRRTMNWFRVLLVAAATLVLHVRAYDVPAGQAADLGELAMDAVPGATFRFDGIVGQRVDTNVENWLLVAPKNNPGLLEMFARRDSGEKPDLVPWAGEFVGKYLISGVQAMRMSDDPRLRETLQGVVDRLVELQAEDGYLGPWPKDERLLAHWDLWGHYHVMLGLMMWHEQTGDRKAMDACRRIGDLVCDTYLDTDRRVHQAGSHEMNMGIIHGMARLYQKTGHPRYLLMAHAVFEDFEAGGDYFRTGLAGREFFRTPRPRWESLHSLQGMVELYRITGDARYRRAFLHHWASIRRFDLRNTGGFSSAERATGNPYRNDAIETCCVIAWQAVMIDALRLTADSRIADDLELATLNAVFGSQHPSGAWCTYDTPMNGRRVPSHVAIKFQARDDTPHLNCCSVNGPRGYGMLSEWGVMQAGDGLAVNYYGPMEADASLADGTPVVIRQQTDYPLGDTVTLTLDTPQPKPFTLRLRIPGWSPRAEVSVGGNRMSDATPVEPGRYVELTRTWQANLPVTLRFDMGLRYEPGDLDQAGRASLYRGPILLALDDRFVPPDSSDSIAAESDVSAGATSAAQAPKPEEAPPPDESKAKEKPSGEAQKPAEPKKPASKLAAVPPMDLSKPLVASLVPIDGEVAERAGDWPPWLVVDVPAGEGATLRLVDFASAGATGGEYLSWLPAAGLRPPRPVAWQPADRARIGPGPIRFSWRPPGAEAAQSRRHSVVVADSPTFERIVLTYGDQTGRRLVVPPEEAAKLEPQTPYYWKVVARNPLGESESIGPFKHFVIDPGAPPMPVSLYGEREPDGMITAARLNGRVEPEYGTLVGATGWKPAAGPQGEPDGAIELDGRGMVKYQLAAFPEEYTVSIWVAVTELPKDRFGQVFSAWCASMDDPLRLAVDHGKLFARIEAGRGYGTEGVELEPGRWYHVAGVKQGDELVLYVDGKVRASARAPWLFWSGATDFALGGNPNYTHGPEFLPARLADLRFYARGLSAEEVKALHETGSGAP